MVSNHRLLFAKVPQGYPIAGETTEYDTSQTIDLDNVPLNGGFLLKTLVVASDPYLRGRMRDPDIQSYAPPFIPGQPLNNVGVGLVLRSDDPKYAHGDYLYGFLTFESYAVRKEGDAIVPFTKLQYNPHVPWALYMGILGVPGQTAYFGWKAFIQEKAAKATGQTLFVTSGASAVGSVVCQLGKLHGLKVIASARTSEKVEFIKSLGVDVAFNYKEQDTALVLRKHGPIDIYWDNVADKTLDDAIDALSVHGLIVACGAITIYNQVPYGIKNFGLVFSKSLSIHGLLYSDHMKYMPDFFAEFPALLAQGKLKSRELRYEGLRAAEQAIIDVQKGTNFGKAVIVVAEE